jgi:4-hydroxy-tetrahydrodipicolinate reductase
MNIAIIGYGKMGRMIEQAAISRHHNIVCTIDADEQQKFQSDEFKSADVAIEFSVPNAAVDNYKKAFAAGVPVVSGTTGWLKAMPEIQNICNSGLGTLLYASNFSIGVNIFMAVNKFLSKIMNDFAEYAPRMEEVHHIHKLDHPSGTAITLAEELAEECERINSWAEPHDGDSTAANVMPITCRREGEVPGIHEITWESPADTITLCHSAKTRAGFAMGAVIAAEWLAGKKGFFSMHDVMADITSNPFFK